MYNNGRYARERARKGGVELQELMRKKAFISDMDGVIYHGNLLLPGVREFVNWLEANGKEYIFLTNSSERSTANRSPPSAPWGCWWTPT